MSRSKNTVATPGPHPARETGAMRESIGTKIDTTLVPFDFICAVAAGLNYGAKKYGARNWEKGLNLSDLLNSVDRHNRAIMNGEQMDHSSGLPHMVLLASSAAMLVSSMIRGIAVDDRAEGSNFDVEDGARRLQCWLDAAMVPVTRA